MLRFRSAVLLVALVSVAPFAMPGSTFAAVCTKDYGACTLQLSTSVWTGEPTILCQQGVPVIKIDITMTCEDLCQSTQSFLRCGNSATAIVTSGCGTGFIVKLASGRDWEDVLTDCSALSGW